jgi:hypothetical protein
MLYRFIFFVPLPLILRFSSSDEYGVRESISAAYLYRAELLFFNSN